MTRPSFVLFMTDQHRADFLGCMGHPSLRTPNIDALAAAGLCHDRFYVASPVCMPNRASLMTCRMPSSHGVWTNGTPLSKRNVTFVELLRDAGYDTALIGKSHLETFAPVGPHVTRPDPRENYHAASGDLAQAERTDVSFEEYIEEQPATWAAPDARIETPFYGFDHVELVTGHGDRLGGNYARWLHERVEDPAALTGAANQLDHDLTCPQAVRTRVPEELYSTTWIAERAEAWLAARKGNERPFFLMVSWPDPHHPFNPPGRYWDMYDPADMAVPEAFGRDDWTPPSFVDAAIRARETAGAMVDGFLSIASTAREAREARALTCGMVTMIDDAVGRVRAALEATGRGDDTVEIFTSDHGDHLGDHRLLFKGIEQYEQITRVPFIWTDPEGAKGVRSDKIGQTHDIGASILERARIEPAWGMQGRPLPSLGGPVRRAAYIEYDQQIGAPGLGPHPRVHTARTDRWRLSLYEGADTGELYDLETDPGELDNLWDDPGAAGAKAAMLEILARLQMETADRLPLPTGMA